jgi:hypothetical protein
LSPFSACATEDITAIDINSTRYLYLALCILQPSIRLFDDLLSEIVRKDGKVCDPVYTDFSVSYAERGSGCQTPDSIRFDGYNRIREYFVR